MDSPLSGKFPELTRVFFLDASLINIEKVISRPYDQPRDETPTHQHLMGLYRARIISKLYDQFYGNRQAALLL